MSKSVRVNRNLIVDRNIFDFLTNTNNIICSVILNANTEEGISYLSTSDKSDMISYLPSDKLKEEYGFDPFGRGVGRGVGVLVLVVLIFPSWVVVSVVLVTPNSRYDIPTFVFFFA